MLTGVAPGTPTFSPPPWRPSASPHDSGRSACSPQWSSTSGGKLSKTLYVRYGAAYADLPESFLDLDVLLDHHGDDALDAIWAEVQLWAIEPRRLHRAYTVDYLADLLPKVRIPSQAPTARTVREPAP